MKSLSLSLVLVLSTIVLSAQNRIDGTFAFQTDSAKKYSLYVPSTYEAGTPHRLMIGFHPLNTNRWDAESWCDTLIQFAETNNLILACPDGGVDGAVDDPIDTAFTTALIDSMLQWYSINTEKVYAMGFSWGGLTTYTYGLNHIERFRGFMPIGAAINGTSPINSVIQNAAGKPYYLVHGNQDSPNSRYFPLLQALEDNNAIVNSILMPGVGHTIDFPNRNAILTTAFEWIDSVNCNQLTDIEILEDRQFFELFPNPVKNNAAITINLGDDQTAIFELEILNQQGQVIQQKSTYSGASFPIQLPVGNYYFRITQKGKVLGIKPVLVVEE